MGRRMPEAQEEQQCRICLVSSFDEEEAEADEEISSNATRFVAPCVCKGSQEWVHLECLRAWQSSCMKSGSVEKANFCSVCKSKFKFAPPRRTLREIMSQMVEKITLKVIIGISFLILPVAFIFRIVVIAALLVVLHRLVRTFVNRIRKHRRRRHRILPVPDNHRQQTVFARSWARRQDGANGIKEGALLELRDGRKVLIDRIDSRGTRGVVVNRQAVETSQFRLLGRSLRHPHVWVGSGGQSFLNAVTVLHSLDKIPGSWPVGNSSDLRVGHYATLRFLELEMHKLENPSGKVKIIFGSLLWKPGEIEQEIHQKSINTITNNPGFAEI